MAVFNSNILAGASGQTSGAAAAYQVDRSLRFNNDDSAHLKRDPSSAGNVDTWTWSGWVKRSGLGFHTDFFSAVQNGQNATIIQFDNNNRLDFENFVGNSDKGRKITNEFFTDTSAWYHIVVAYDSTNSTADDRVKIYVNGSQITSFNYSTNPDSGQNTIINSTNPHYLGVDKGFSNHYFDGYLADVNFVDGRALTADDFAEYDDNNVWQPKKFTSFNNPNNGTTWSDAVPTADGFRPGRAAEDGFDGDLTTYVAIDNTTFNLDVGSWNLTGTVEVYTGANMQYAVDGGSATSMTADDWTNVGDAGSIDTLTFTRTDGNYPYFYAIRVRGYVLIDDSGDNSFHLDLSDNSSAGALGYDAAVTAPTLNPKGGMDVVTYTGTGSSQSFPLSFQPDLIWCKTRSNPVDHKLVDSVRGLTNVLETNQDRAESTGITTGITATSATGFTIGSSGDFNTSGRTYVAWCWKAGGTAVSNSDGTITSQVSASTDYGFSVVTYTGNSTAGATIGHGLDTAPDFIIIKNRDRAINWAVGHSGNDGFANGNQLRLNTNDAVASSEEWFNDTDPTSSVFTVKNNFEVNYASEDYVAYCWHEVSGFSKFGSYSGTGAAGVSVTTGFKPRWVMIKETTNSNHWYIYDTQRGATNILWASSSNSESDIGSGDGTNQNAIEVSDTGFSIPHTLSGTNRNGGTFIYAAFADRPGNNFDVNNLSVAAGADNDSLLDTPTNYEASSGENGGNYCTWNPNDMETSVITLSEGNLKTITTSSTGDNVRGTLGFSSGKWYWECTVTNFSGGFDIGFATPEWNLTSGDVGSVANSWSVSDSGTSKAEGSTSSGATDAFNSAGKVIGIAFDADAGSVKYFIDGTDQGVIFSGLDTSYTYIPAIYLRVGTTGGIWNFGQRGSFTYDPPSGYKGLCTQNLADPGIADGSSCFTSVNYAGNSGDGLSTTQDIVTTFSPDLVWIKDRTGTNSHHLFDTIRGAGKRIFSNSTSSESDVSSTLSAFNSDGFTVNGNNAVNDVGSNYISWNWDAGSSTASNTDGSITANVRTNTSAGFSIIQFLGNATSGATVGHGLNAAPELVIGKNRGGGDAWWVWFKAISSNASAFLKLNTTGTSTSTQYIANNTAPSSTVITLGSDYGWNSSQSPGSILYAFTPVSGYSAFGDYTGASDKFIYTGFKPQWLMLKSYAGDGFNWVIIDDERGADTSNVSNKLYPNLNGSEDSDSRGTETKVVFLSNGFTFLDEGAETNSSSRSYVYAAFASHPLKYSRAGF